MSIEYFPDTFQNWVQCSNARLLIRHKTIYEKNIFQTLLQTTGDSKFWSQNIREIYVPEKNIIFFLNPLAWRYKMPSESDFMKHVLENRRKCRTLLYIGQKHFLQIYIGRIT